MVAVVPALADEVALLVAQLKTDQAHQAAERLAELGPAASSAVPDLVLALESADAELRWRAAWALSRIGPDAASAAPAILSAWERQDVLGAAATGIAISRSGRRSAHVILAALPDAPEGKQESLLLFLRKMDPDPEATLPALVSLLERTNGSNVYDICAILEKMTQAAEPFVPTFVRRWAEGATRYEHHRSKGGSGPQDLSFEVILDMIVATGDPAVVPLRQVAMSFDVPAGVRGDAAGALARTGALGVAAATELLRTLDRGALPAALYEIKDAGPAAAELIPALEARIPDGDAPPYNAAEVLLSMGPKGVESLERLLLAGSPAVRKELMRQLRREAYPAAFRPFLRLAAIKGDGRRDALLALADLRLEGAEAREAAKLAASALDAEPAAACRLAGSLGVLGISMADKMKRLLKHDDLGVRAAAASARCQLGKGGRAEVEILWQALQDRDDLESVQCLARAGRTAASMWDLLLPLLDHPNWDLRPVAARGLGFMFPALDEQQRRQVVAAVKPLLTSHRAPFLDALSRTGEVATLVDLLSIEAPHDVCDVLVACGSRAWKPLAAALHGDDAGRRTYAAWCLVKIDAARAGERAWLEIARARLLGAIEPSAGAPPEVGAVLVKALRTGTSAERAAAACLLARGGCRDAVPSLWKVVKEETDAAARRDALVALDVLLPAP